MVTATEMEWHDRMVPTVFYFIYPFFFGATAGLMMVTKMVTAGVEMVWHDRMVPTSFLFYLPLFFWRYSGVDDGDSWGGDGVA
jgi:hypothetical protein